MVGLSVLMVIEVSVTPAVPAELEALAALAVEAERLELLALALDCDWLAFTVSLVFFCSAGKQGVSDMAPALAPRETNAE